MRYVIGPRGSGRSTKVLQWAVSKQYDGTTFCIICITANEARRLERALLDSGLRTGNGACLSISNTAAIRHWLSYCPDNRAIAIDNYDLMRGEEVDSFVSLGDVQPRIELVTLTGPVKNF